MALCRWSFSPEHPRGQLRSVSSVATWVQGEQRDRQSSSDGAETPAPGLPRGVGPAGSTAPLQTRTKPFLPLHHLPRASHQLCRPAPGIWPELDKYSLNERNHHQGYMPTKASTQTLLDLEGPLPHRSDLPGGPPRARAPSTPGSQPTCPAAAGAGPTCLRPSPPQSYGHEASGPLPLRVTPESQRLPHRPWLWPRPSADKHGLCACSVAGAEHGCRVGGWASGGVPQQHLPGSKVKVSVVQRHTRVHIHTCTCTRTGTHTPLCAVSLKQPPCPFGAGSECISLSPTHWVVPSTAGPGP